MALVDELHKVLKHQGVTRAHVAAVLDELHRRVIIIEEHTLPDLYFDENDESPVVRFVRHWGTEQKTVPFGHQHLLVRRATTAAREALAVLSEIRRDRSSSGFFAAQHEAAKQAYLRRRLVDQHIVDGGSAALANGALWP